MTWLQQLLTVIVCCGNPVLEIVLTEQLQISAYSKYQSIHMLPRALLCGNSLISELPCAHQRNREEFLKVKKRQAIQNPWFFESIAYGNVNNIPHANSRCHGIGNCRPVQAYMYEKATCPGICFPWKSMWSIKFIRQVKIKRNGDWHEPNTKRLSYHIQLAYFQVKILKHVVSSTAYVFANFCQNYKDSKIIWMVLESFYGKLILSFNPMST